MGKKKSSIYLIVEDPKTISFLESILKGAGYRVELCQERAPARILSSNVSPTLIILAEQLEQGDSLDFAENLARQYPKKAIILYVNQGNLENLVKRFRTVVSNYLLPSMTVEEVLNTVKETLESRSNAEIERQKETRRVTSNLKRRVDEMATLARLGQSITASLDLDSVLSAVVSAAVELTGAEEGSLLFLDETTGELYMRASRNIQEEMARTFRIPVNDTLAGSVVQTCQPVIINKNTLSKIKTAYLVHSLVYVPLGIQGKVFGVLGVDNRSLRKSFFERDVTLLEAVAEYGVIAIENARLFTDTIQSRRKLEAVLEQIQDGVIVLDQEKNLVLINKAAQMILGLKDQQPGGKQFTRMVNKPDLRELREGVEKGKPRISEIFLDDGRIFNTCITLIPAVGMAITMHDITTLKKLDQIKSEFVSTVSHDLRSPLTAIMGYVDLIDRAGPINDLQRDFIGRVHISVQSITRLVDDLLNLGKIEAGFDIRKEDLDITQLVRSSVDGFSSHLAEKNLQLDLQLEILPAMLANPVQFRQMVDNLLENAIKYSSPFGTIQVSGKVEENQVILQVKDGGIGIPAEEIPHIFNKFYRASNVSSEISGTGLGLAIVKSIVDNHRGRIWIDSTIGQGTCVTVVFQVENEQ